MLSLLVHLVALLTCGRLDEWHELIFLCQRLEQRKDEWNVVEAATDILNLMENANVTMYEQAN